MKRRTFLRMATVGVVLAGLSAAARAGDPVRVRVLTYNIHRGVGDDGKFDLERIAKVIVEQRPDLVALQEVDVGTRRSNGVDIATRLGELTRMSSRFAAAMPFDGGEYGDCVLTPHEIVEAKAYPLPAPPKSEPRVLLRARVKHPSLAETIEFGVTHLDHANADVRVDQVREIAKTWPAGGGPLEILAGDLNATPDSGAIKELTARWTDADAAASRPTFPAKKPRIRIDYVLFRPAANWKGVSATVIDEKVASDHAPLLTVFEQVGSAR